MAGAPAASALSALEDAHAIRRAGRDLLSVALIDSRNRLLRLLEQGESGTALQRAAWAGWYQEYWIAGHVQRQRGEACDPSAPRLAGIEPAAEHWIEGRQTPPAQALRGYLQDTLETTLDLLAGSEESDAGLCFFRLALMHEDRLCEAMALQLGAGNPPARPQRAALWFPGQRWQLGSPPGGLVPWPERWAHEVVVPEFEIDAQPVNWSQFVEFAADGGYDRREWWDDEGWAWLEGLAAQGQGRRAPRDGEQLRGGVLVMRRLDATRSSPPPAAPEAGAAAVGHGAPGMALQHAAAGQPVLQVSRFEAQAWCAWAGRRLATEPEWELAACTAGSRGFAWGDVLEWVAGRARAWPGAGEAPPGHLEAGPGARLRGVAAGGDAGSPAAGATGQREGVLRGATGACHLRWRHPKARRFSPLGDDAGPIGFRSCAL
jgi:formylglycine-generating enzyme required for sulfatase activity